MQWLPSCTHGPWVPHWNAVTRVHTTIHNPIITAVIRVRSRCVSNGDRLKMFWQADSLAVARDRMKRISLAY
jgi:hypothetical protein